MYSIEVPEDRPFIEKAIRGIAAHVDLAPDGCWAWNGATERSGTRRGDGYPRITIRKTSYRAARVAWTVSYGAIPPEMTVDHLCFNVLCVNPRHMRLMTQPENSANQRRWANRTTCEKGHPLTDSNVATRMSHGVPQRRCRTCERAASARYRAPGGAL